MRSWIRAIESCLEEIHAKSIDHIIIHYIYVSSVQLTTQLTSTARQRRNTTDNRIVRVVLRSRQVQALQALGKDVHDLGGHFADIGVLYQLALHLLYSKESED